MAGGLGARQAGGGLLVLLRRCDLISKTDEVGRLDELTMRQLVADVLDRYAASPGGT